MLTHPDEPVGIALKGIISPTDYVKGTSRLSIASSTIGQQYYTGGTCRRMWYDGPDLTGHMPKGTSEGYLSPSYDIDVHKSKYSIIDYMSTILYWGGHVDVSGLNDPIRLNGAPTNERLEDEWHVGAIKINPTKICLNSSIKTALAKSLNIPEGSQDKDSLKVLTELPRSESMKVLALLVGSLVIVVMKNEGALLHFYDMGKDHGMRKRKKSNVDSELRLNRKHQAARTTPKAVSSATKAKQDAVAYSVFQLHCTGRGPYLL
ncbi:hypothetical protein Tco_0290149 [Tanacetum coccineum]